MNRRMVMMMVSVLLAVVGVGAVYAYVQSADGRLLAGKQAVRVLVASKPIPAGTALRDLAAAGALRTDVVPASARPADAVTDPASGVTTDVALADVAPGQILVRAMFGSRPPTTSGLQIPKGMVAVSVAVSTGPDVAGFVQQGSQVAVFDTYLMIDAHDPAALPAGVKEASEKADNYATKLVLPRATVLAVSQAAPTAQPTPGQAPTAGADTVMVTLAVAQTDAERLIQVQQTGKLYLGLLTDSSVTGGGPGVDNQGTLGKLFPTAAPTSAPVAP